jgi:hypothetical protein
MVKSLLRRDTVSLSKAFNKRLSPFTKNSEGRSLWKKKEGPVVSPFRVEPDILNTILLYRCFYIAPLDAQAYNFYIKYRWASIGP